MPLLFKVRAAPLRSAHRKVGVRAAKLPSQLWWFRLFEVVNLPRIFIVRVVYSFKAGEIGTTTIMSKNISKAQAVKKVPLAIASQS